MYGLPDFYHSRAADVRAAQTMLLNIWRTKSLPASQEITIGRICTPLALLLVLNLLASLSTSHGRRRVMELTEAVLASIFMASLLLAVLGMPIGAIYLVLKAVAYFIRALLSLPYLSGFFSPLKDFVGA